MSQHDAVELTIEARNLATEELNEAARSVEGLGNAARQTEQELNQLEIDQSNLESFTQVRNELRDLRREAAQSEVAYQDLNQSVRANANATEEQRVEVVQARQALNEQRADIRRVEREYNRLGTALRETGVNLRNSVQEQERLTDQIERSRGRLSTQTRLYQEQTAALRQKVQAEKESRRENDQLESETDRITRSVREYEQALEQLNRELERGVVSKADYIRGEANLRNQLQLTESQVRTSRQAIQAESAERTNAIRGTDALTSVTRRLAQAYTVLIAAQQGTEALRASVQGYGDLEQALVAVQKTTGLATSEILNITDTLREQSETVLPSSTNELLRYSEIAGQLGVTASEDILQIVAAADALAVSTNLAGDEAATLLTRILQVTGEGVGNINNLGSSFAALGNNAATTEADIANMTREIVTGTRAINLSSSAAAGLGTTLLELGLPAERSRTAIQRLAEVINQAAVEGGESLEQLTRITGLTADEFERSLGDAPERVITAFLEGLVRLETQGQVTSQTLSDIGIQGQDAIGVFNQLAGNTDLLQQRLALSNNEYARGRALIEEASRAYATQNADVARLVNQFNNLRDSIGEAYADETNEAIDLFSDLIENNTESVIGLMEWIPQLVEGLGEIVGIFEDIGGDIEIGAVFDGIANSIRIAVNVVTQSIRQFLLFAAEAGVAIGEFVGVSEERMASLRETSARLTAAIAEDSNDIGQSVARILGESSRAYEDFQDALNNFSGEIENLDPVIQAQIATLQNQGRFVAENEAEYRKLTAAIIANHRQLEVEAELAKRAEQAKQNEAIQRQLLLEAIQREQENKQGLLDLDTRLVGVTGEVIEANNRVNDSYRVQSDTLIRLAADIAETEANIVELERAARSQTATQSQLAESTADLRREQARLNTLRREQQDLVAIENASFAQLTTLQAQYQLQLDNLNIAFQNNNITLAEYTAGKERLTGILATLSAALGENTEEVDRNTEALLRNQNVANGQVQQQEKIQRFTSLAAGAYANLNKEFDFSSQSIEELNARSAELLGNIRQNQIVTDQWWRSLAQLSNQAFTRERQIIQETIQLRRWREEVESGTLSLSDLNRIADSADRGLTQLGENQLQPLLNAIDEARSKLLSFRDEVAEVTADVQDRLDEAEGNLEAIARRRFEREQQELRGLIEQAELIGDNQAVERLRRALEQLRRAQRLEFERDFGRDAGRIGGGRGTTGSGDNGNVTLGRYELRVTDQTGRESATVTGTQQDVTGLLSILEQAQNVNNTGNA